MSRRPTTVWHEVAGVDVYQEAGFDSFIVAGTQLDRRDFQPEGGRRIMPPGEPQRAGHTHTLRSPARHNSGVGIIPSRTPSVRLPSAKKLAVCRLGTGRATRRRDSKPARYGQTQWPGAAALAHRHPRKTAYLPQQQDRLLATVCTVYSALI
jgi:hypothetical protein